MTDLENIGKQITKYSSELPEGVKLVAVSKFHPVEALRAAYDAGQRIFGESRVQEIQQKHRDMPEDVEWHFIGHLQKNKVKNIVGKVELIHSVDSVSLAQEINRRAAALGITQDILLEVNIGAEENKSGFAPDELAGALDEIAQFSSVRVLGLMAIPPICEISENNRVYFRRMKQLFIDIGQKKYDNVCMLLLSMGMSADYEVAVEEGASLVRVGTGIFGARNYK